MSPYTINPGSSHSMSYHQWSLNKPEVPSQALPMPETRREASDQGPPTSESSSRALSMTDGQKLDFVFYHLKKWKWSLGAFLAMLSSPKWQALAIATLSKVVPRARERTVLMLHSSYLATAAQPPLPSLK